MSAPQDQLGVAIVGCGHWGMNYVRVFSELTNAVVVAVCDSQRGRLDEVAKRYPEMKLTERIEDALKIPRVDAVVISTEAATHYRLVSEALRAQKHVLVEKPITTVVREAEKLVEYADRKRLTLMVGHTFLYNPGVRMLKEQIRHPDMGRIYYLYSRRTNLGPIRQDVNAVWDLAAHDVSVFDFLLDDQPTWVSAVGHNVLHDSREDAAFITLGYGSKILGNIHVSWVEPNKVRQLVVVGGHKRIVFDDLDASEQVKIFERGVSPAPPEASTYGEYQLQFRDGDIVSPKVEISEPLKNQCLHFVDCATRGVRPLSDGLSGLEVVRVLEAIDTSMARLGAPVAVESGASVNTNRLEDENQVAANVFTPGAG